MLGLLVSLNKYLIAHSYKFYAYSTQALTPISVQNQLQAFFKDNGEEYARVH